jgi:hypothetical protein
MKLPNSTKKRETRATLIKQQFIKEMAKEERGMQREENSEKKQTREQEENRETTWRTLRAFSLENKAGIEKLLTED